MRLGLAFWGIAHPAAGDARNEWPLERTDLAYCARTAVGGPVCLRHDDGAAFGTVKRAWVDRDGALNVIGLLSENDASSLAPGIASAALRTGLYRELSMRGLVGFDRRGAIRSLGPTEEISLVPAGSALRGPGCAVLGVFEVDGRGAARSVGGDYNKMTGALLRRTEKVIGAAVVDASTSMTEEQNAVMADAKAAVETTTTKATEPAVDEKDQQIQKLTSMVTELTSRLEEEMRFRRDTVEQEKSKLRELMANARKSLQPLIEKVWPGEKPASLKPIISMMENPETADPKQLESIAPLFALTMQADSNAREQATLVRDLRLKVTELQESKESAEKKQRDAERKQREQVEETLRKAESLSRLGLQSRLAPDIEKAAKRKAETATPAPVAPTEVKRARTDVTSVPPSAVMAAAGRPAKDTNYAAHIDPTVLQMFKRYTGQSSGGTAVPLVTTESPSLQQVDIGSDIAGGDMRFYSMTGAHV
jgi:hypothetical protein